MHDVCSAEKETLRDSVLKEPANGFREDFVGIYDVARDLPREYVFEHPDQLAWHCSPSPDGRRLVMDQRGGTGGIVVLEPDDARGICRVEPLTSVCSDGKELGAHAASQQWSEQDPVWSPDGKKVLFRAAHEGRTHVYVVETGM